jgi:cytochrome b561
LLGCAALLCLAAAPRQATADLLPEGTLTLRFARPLLVASASQAAAPGQAAAPQAQPPDLSLDFDLLGTPALPQVKFDDALMKRRRTMLDIHQKVGIGLVALTLATTVVGQLNYADKYGSNAPVTGKYQASHAVLSVTTLTVFAANGALALFTPDNPVKKEHYDRMTVHKAGMAVATAGMIAQGVLGAYTTQREGRIDQASLARAHLVIGYATLAAMAVGVGALVF